MLTKRTDASDLPNHVGTIRRITVWERHVREYEKATRDRISDFLKASAMRDKICPPEIREHLFKSAATILDYKDLKDAATNYCILMEELDDRPGALELGKKGKRGKQGDGEGKKRRKEGKGKKGYGKGKGFKGYGKGNKGKEVGEENRTPTHQTPRARWIKFLQFEVRYS